MERTKEAIDKLLCQITEAICFAVKMVVFLIALVFAILFKFLVFILDL